MDYTNYVPIRKLSTKYQYFCYLDTCDYLADDLFIKNEIKVWFKQEYQKPGTDFVAIFCKVRKTDADKFLETLEELKNKMLLLGYTNYPEFCEQTFTKMLHTFLPDN